MDGRCDKHPFEASSARCRECGGEYCPDCLVYPFGEKKPPFCIGCAIAAAGVRSSSARPHRVSKRELRREEKERRKAEKVAARAQPTPFGDDPFDESDGARVPVPLVTFEMEIADDGSVRRAS